MKVADLSVGDFAAALKAEGLVIRLGPFAVGLRITEPTLVPPLHGLFALYDICPRDSTVLSFQVDILRERRPADLFRPGFTTWLDGGLEGRSLSLPLALPTLEWTINWGVGTTAHRFLMLHAAVAERDGAAVVMPGAPGSGKSTLCAYLVARGWRLFSDEFALVVPETDRLVPMPRPISLKNRSVELIRGLAPHLHFGPVIEGTLKGAVALLRPPADSVARQDETAPLRWVVFPKWQEGEEAVLEPLDPITLFRGLTGDAINYEVLGERGFRALRRLVEGCAGYRLRYGSLDDAARLIESLGSPTPAGERASHVAAG